MSRITSKYMPVLVLWAEIPLRLGIGHLNVLISGVAFIALLGLQQWSTSRPQGEVVTIAVYDVTPLAKGDHHGRGYIATLDGWRIWGKRGVQGS